MWRDSRSDTLFEGGNLYGRRYRTARLCRPLRSRAGLAATAGSASAAGLEVVETDVEIKTPDGTCDAAFIHPKSGSHPGVLIWPDAFGLRPSMRDMGKRLAAEGYSVLVPNPFYRVAKAPFTDAVQLQLRESDGHGEDPAADGVGQRARQRRKGRGRLRRVSRRAKSR